jgi:glycosyltransferase involved in cell wall biosynthesis
VPAALRSSSSTCGDGFEAVYNKVGEQRERVVTKLLSVVGKLLKGLVPAPLRRPMREAVLGMIPPVRRLRRAWRRRARLTRRVRRIRNQLRLRARRMRNRLKRRWLHIRLPIRLLRIHIRLSTWHWRRRNRPVENSNEIHLISPLRHATGGVILRTLHLFDELKAYRKVSLWSEREPHPAILERYPVRRIVPERFEFPKTGTFVFVGVFFPVGPWIRYTDPRRVILIYNTWHPGELRRKLRQLSNGGRRKVEVAYASELMKRTAGNHPGFVEPSLIDVDRFVPAPKEEQPSDPNSAAFTVGRLSRPVSHKHHPEDAALYRRLAEEGCQVRIMGPSPSLEAELGGIESVTLLPMGAQEAHLFLQGLDCFFYRTSEEWSEPWGRVVTEAMACGLAVVCQNRGGYAEVIEHGRNGFLFETQQEALQILLGLKEDPALRDRVGKEARRTAEELFSGDRRSELVDFYLR